MLEAVSLEILKAAKDIGEGGLAITLAQMALGNGEHRPMGCNVHTSLPSQVLFAPSQSCIIVEIAVENLALLTQMAKKHKIPLHEIGCVGGDHFCCDEINLSLQEISELYFTSFEAMINQDV